MVGYHAQIDALRKAATASSSAAEQVREIDLASAISEARDGMPGAVSLKVFGRLGDVWKDDLARWAQEARSYADALVTAADNYAANESAAQSDFDAHSPSGRAL